MSSSKPVRIKDIKDQPFHILREILYVTEALLWNIFTGTLNLTETIVLRDFLTALIPWGTEHIYLTDFFIYAYSINFEELLDIQADYIANLSGISDTVTIGEVFDTIWGQWKPSDISIIDSALLVVIASEELAAIASHQASITNIEESTIADSILSTIWGKWQPSSITITESVLLMILVWEYLTITASKITSSVAGIEGTAVANSALASITGKYLTSISVIEYIIMLINKQEPISITAQKISGSIGGLAGTAVSNSILTSIFGRFVSSTITFTDVLAGMFTGLSEPLTITASKILGSIYGIVNTVSTTFNLSQVNARISPQSISIIEILDIISPQSTVFEYLTATTNKIAAGIKGLPNTAVVNSSLTKPSGRITAAISILEIGELDLFGKLEPMSTTFKPYSMLKGYSFAAATTISLSRMKGHVNKTVSIAENLTYTCNTPCLTACQIGCETACQICGQAGFCQTTCQITCQVCGQAISCQTACQLACQTGCMTTCQTGCQTVCQTSCQISCQTTCQLACQTGCMTTCQDTCELYCQACGQTGFCETGCEVVCQTTCEVDCQTACQVACQSYCETQCQVGCEINCQICGQVGQEM